MTNPTTEIREVHIDEVKPYYRNPRNATDKAIESLMDSIERYGYQQPIVVDPDLFVITGHTRLIALRRLGWERFPVLVSNLPPDKVAEYRVIDNRTAEHTTWDHDNLLLELREFVDSEAMAIHFPEVDLSLDFSDDNLDLDTEDMDQAAADLEASTSRDLADTRQVTCPHCYESFDLTI